MARPDSRGGRGGGGFRGGGGGFRGGGGGGFRGGGGGFRGGGGGRGFRGGGGGGRGFSTPRGGGGGFNKRLGDGGRGFSSAPGKFSGSGGGGKDGFRGGFRGDRGSRGGFGGGRGMNGRGGRGGSFRGRGGGGPQKSFNDDDSDADSDSEIGSEPEAVASSLAGKQKKLGKPTKPPVEDDDDVDDSDEEEDEVEDESEEEEEEAVPTPAKTHKHDHHGPKSMPAAEVSGEDEDSEEDEDEDDSALDAADLVSSEDEITLHKKSTPASKPVMNGVKKVPKAMLLPDEQEDDSEVDEDGSGEELEDESEEESSEEVKYQLVDAVEPSASVEPGEGHADDSDEVEDEEELESEQIKYKLADVSNPSISNESGDEEDDSDELEDEEEVETEQIKYKLADASNPSVSNESGEVDEDDSDEEDEENEEELEMEEVGHKLDGAAEPSESGEDDEDDSGEELEDEEELESEDEGEEVEVPGKSILKAKLPKNPMEEDSDDDDDDDADVEDGDVDVDDEDDEDDDESVEEDDEVLQAETLRKLIAMKEKQLGSAAKKDVGAKKHRPEPQPAEMPGQKRKNNDSFDVARVDSAPAGKMRKMQENLDIALRNSGVMTEEERRRQLTNRVTLFVKDLPNKITDKEVMKFSSDILTFRRKGPTCRFGWLTFANEAVADANYRRLSTLVMPGGHKLVVDYVGVKSKLKNKDVDPKSTNAKPPPAALVGDNQIIVTDLCIPGLPAQTTPSDLRSLFPQSADISIPSFEADPRTSKFAFVHFQTGAMAMAAFEKYQKLAVHGVPVSVYFKRAKLEKAEKPKKKAKGKQILKGGPSDEGLVMNGDVGLSKKQRASKTSLDEEKIPKLVPLATGGKQKQHDPAHDSEEDDDDDEDDDDVEDEDDEEGDDDVADEDEDESVEEADSDSDEEDSD